MTTSLSSRLRRRFNQTAKDPIQKLRELIDLNVGVPSRTVKERIWISSKHLWRERRLRVEVATQQKRTAILRISRLVSSQEVGNDWLESCYLNLRRRLRHLQKRKSKTTSTSAKMSKLMSLSCSQSEARQTMTTTKKTSGQIREIKVPTSDQGRTRSTKHLISSIKAWPGDSSSPEVLFS